MTSISLGATVDEQSAQGLERPKPPGLEISRSPSARSAANPFHEKDGISSVGIETARAAS